MKNNCGLSPITGLVNSKKDELTIAIKALADTAKQFVNVYANQQAQIVTLAKRVEELEKAKQ